MNDLLNKYYENYEEGVDKLNFNEKLNTFRNKSEQNYELIFHLDGTLGNIACLSYAVIKLKLNVLAVTFNHHDFTNSEKLNIKRAGKFFDLDHIFFTPRKSVIDTFDKKFPKWLPKIKSIGIDVLTLIIASKYNVSLIKNYTGSSND